MYSEGAALTCTNINNSTVTINRFIKWNLAVVESVECFKLLTLRDTGFVSIAYEPV